MRFKEVIMQRNYMRSYKARLLEWDLVYHNRKSSLDSRQNAPLIRNSPRLFQIDAYEDMLQQR